LSLFTVHCSYSPVFPPDLNIGLDDVKKIPALIHFAENMDLSETISWLNQEWFSVLLKSQKNERNRWVPYSSLFTCHSSLLFPLVTVYGNHLLAQTTMPPHPH